MTDFSATVDWPAAVAALRNHESVLLIAHVTPDADALGSALALGLALRKMGKSVQVSVGEAGFIVPSSLNFLPGIELIVAPEEAVPSDVVVICDTSSVERLGVLREVVLAAPISIAIDHHPTFNGFGTVHLIDPGSPATAALVLQLIDLLDVTLDADIAAAVYAGLATDTGSFKFQSTDASTLRMAARLFDTGFEHAPLARKLFDDESFEALQVLGTAMSQAQLLPELVGGKGFVFTSISQEQRHDLPELALERVIETLRRTSEAEVAAVFKQSDDGTWKGSLRSKTCVNVAEVASSLGGGGHRYAAGFTAQGDLASAVADLIAALTSHVAESPGT